MILSITSDWSTVLTTVIVSVLTYFTLKTYNAKFVRYVKLCLNPPPLITVLHRPEAPLIHHPKVETLLLRAFNFAHGGVFVLYSILGSGKTTYLSKLAWERRAEGKHAYMFLSVANKRHLYDLLGIEHLHYLLSEILPVGSVLILDQTESSFGPDAEAMIWELALDSRNSKSFVVIVSVSVLDVANKVLNINGREKIVQLGPETTFKWDAAMIDTFIARSTVLKNRSKNDKKVIRELALRAGTPSFLSSLATDWSSTITESYKKKATEVGSSWSDKAL